jgi:hypothetical protein
MQPDRPGERLNRQTGENFEEGGPTMIASEHRRLRLMPQGEQLRLETLERLPCGCIVAIQSVRPSRVTVVSIEAKGPHCTYAPHRANKVIRLGGSLDALDYDEEDETSL